MGAGESAAFVAKQFGFDERFGDRRAVDIDKGGVAAWALIVDGLGN